MLHKSNPTQLTEIGKVMRAIRVQYGLRILDMADDLGVSPATISSWEYGRKPAPDDLADRLEALYPKAQPNE